MPPTHEVGRASTDMNVACTACPAKYAVPDEKVRGRKVKITCKHCGTAIIVDGTKIGTEGATGAPKASVVPASTASVVPTAATASVGPAPAGVSVAPAAKATRAEAPAAKLAQGAAARAAAEQAPPEAPKPEPADEAPAPTAAPEPEPPAEIEWIVAFSDDRQDPATTAQVVEYYRAGHIDEGTYIWREGMTDWAAPYDIPELRDALRAAGVARRSPPPPPFVGDEDEATRVVSSPIASEGTTSTSGVWREPGRIKEPAKATETPVPQPAAAVESPPQVTAARAEPVRATSKTQTGTPVASKAEAAKPAAAKTGASQRAATRPRQERSAVDDLFGSIDVAGSEHDTSLHQDTSTETSAEAPRLTGQRNETSVLFSLDALIKTEKSTKPEPEKKKDDEAALLFGAPAPSSIANVTTGGIGVALAAPDFTAPVMAPPPSAPRTDAAPIEVQAAPAAKKKNIGLWVALAVLVGGGAAAFAMGLPQKLMGGQAQPPAVPSAEPPKAATEPAPTSTPTVAEPAPAETASAATTAAPPATGTTAQPTEAGKPAEADKAAQAAKPAEAAQPKEQGDAKAAAKPAPKDEAAPAAGGSDLPPFDKAAAAAALGAAAANASSCRQPGGVVGGGRVTVTFAPSGRATNTQVTGELAGTTVGGCVARLFRQVKVPPFSGDPITVGKSFTVE